MSFADQWANASVEDQENQAPPEGEYEVALTKGRAFTAKSGRDVATLAFKVLGPTHEGYEWTEILMFDSQGRANFAKRTVHLLGIDVAEVNSLDDLDSALREQEGRYYALEVKQNGDYRNAYIQGLSARQVPPSQPAVRDDDGRYVNTDDVPF